MLKQTALALVFVILGAGCSDNQSVPAKRQATPLDLSTAGSVSGRVQFEGTAPQPAPLQLGSFAECAVQHEGPIYADDVVVKDGSLANVLVYVKQGLGDRIFAVPETPVVIDQKGCVFVPRVAAVQSGQPVRFMNGDPLAHNVHGVPQNASGWNFMLPVRGAARNVTIDKPEAVIELKCDIHPWMKAYLGVFDHPYFAVTGADGQFELRNLPPGDYEIAAWHERLGTRSATISLAPKEAKTIGFSFSAK
jgi:plastocyanin